MTDSHCNSQFIPLDKPSQGTRIKVLYFDSHAPHIDILECATRRLNAALGLSEILQSLDEPSANIIKNIGIGSHILISDAMCLIDKVQAQVQQENLPP